MTRIPRALRSTVHGSCPRGSPQGEGDVPEPWLLTGLTHRPPATVHLPEHERLGLGGPESQTPGGWPGSPPSTPEALGGTPALHSGARRTLTGVAFAQHLDGGGHLLLADPLVLLSLGGGLQPLPGQRAQVEVHEHVAQRLQVIPSRLFWKGKGKWIEEGARYLQQQALIVEMNFKNRRSLWPRHPEHDRSRPIAEAKRGGAWLVLGWQTTREDQVL